MPRFCEGISKIEKEMSIHKNAEIKKKCRDFKCSVWWLFREKSSSGHLCGFINFHAQGQEKLTIQ